MHTNGGHIRAHVHSGWRQIIAKVKMGAVGLVRQHQQAVAMGQLHNGRQI